MRGMRFRPQYSFSLLPAVTCITCITATTTTLTGRRRKSLRSAGSARASVPVSPAEWMRLYFGHAKTVYRSNLQLLSQISQARSSLYRSFQHWRSRISNSEFSVVDGRVYFQQAVDAREAASVLNLFVFTAKHGVLLSAEAERRISDAHQRLAETMPQDQTLWQYLREILTLATRRTGASRHAFPEPADPRGP